MSDGKKIINETATPVRVEEDAGGAVDKKSGMPACWRNTYGLPED